jgi:hypothetical protein
MASQQYDVWSVTPGSDADFYFASASIAGAGAITLAATTPGINGYGYKVSITSSTDDETGTNFTITGIPVGGTAAVTEVLAGPDGSGGAASVFSTTYFATVQSIVASAATAGAITIGYGGSLALGRCRVKGLYYVGATTAGSISISDAGVTPPRLNIPTPAGSGAFANSLYMAAEGILVGQGQNGYAVVTLTQVTNVTLICG